MLWTNKIVSINLIKVVDAVYQAGWCHYIELRDERQVTVKLNIKEEKRKLNKAIGSYIRQQRLIRGLTQGKCAKCVGVHPQFLYAVEIGKVGCPFPILRGLIKELHLEKRKISSIYREYCGTLVNLLFHP